MAFEFINKLPTPAEIKEQFPLPAEFIARKAERDEEVKKVISGESDKFLVLIGPCSADNEEAVCEYINRLSRVQEEVADKLILIPRIYTNKPRTTGEGYKGILHRNIVQIHLIMCRICKRIICKSIRKFFFSLKIYFFIFFPRLVGRHILVFADLGTLINLLCDVTDLCICRIIFKKYGN